MADQTLEVSKSDQGKTKSTDALSIDAETTDQLKENNLRAGGNSLNRKIGIRSDVYAMNSDEGLQNFEGGKYVGIV